MEMIVLSYDHHHILSLELEFLEGLGDKLILLVTLDCDAKGLEILEILKINHVAKELWVEVALDEFLSVLNVGITLGLEDVLVELSTKISTDVFVEFLELFELISDLKFEEILHSGNVLLYDVSMGVWQPVDMAVDGSEMHHATKKIFLPDCQGAVLTTEDTVFVFGSGVALDGSEFLGYQLVCSFDFFLEVNLNGPSLWEVLKSQHVLDGCLDLMDIIKGEIEQIDVHIVQVFHPYLKGVKIIVPGIGLNVKGLWESRIGQRVHVFKEIVLDLLNDLEDLIGFVAWEKWLFFVYQRELYLRVADLS